MNGRSGQRGSRAVEIFNMSFLDVFACILGVLVLILLMMARLLAESVAPEVLDHRVEAAEKRQAEADARWKDSEPVRAAALEWRLNREAQAAKIAALRTETDRLSKLPEAPARSPSTTPAPEDAVPGPAPGVLDALRKAVADRQARLRESRTRIASPSGEAGTKPRLVMVDGAGARDLRTEANYTDAEAGGPGGWNSFVAGLVRTPSPEYILFVLKPEGFDRIEKYEQALKDRGVPYGIEPYTAGWSALVETDP